MRYEKGAFSDTCFAIVYQYVKSERIWRHDVEVDLLPLLGLYVVLLVRPSQDSLQGDIRMDTECDDRVFIVFVYSLLSTVRTTHPTICQGHDTLYIGFGVLLVHATLSTDGGTSCQSFHVYGHSHLCHISSATVTPWTCYFWIA